MMTTTTEQQQNLLDVLRAKLMVAVAADSIGELAESSQLPAGFNKNVAKQTQEQLQRFNRELIRTAPKCNPNYLTKEPKVEQLNDVATLVELVHRIGAEENNNTYEEFLGIVIDSLWAVWYAQKNRKNLHFGKYKALFKMFADEVKADVNHTPGQVLFTQKGELFLRSSAPVHKPTLKP